MRTRLPALAMLVALSLIPMAAGGQIFKCLGHDGRTTYSDQPCKNAARASELKVEPNVIETSNDGLLGELAGMTPEQIRRQRPTPDCERAVSGLERARRTGGGDPRTLRSAYDEVLASCTVGGTATGIGSAVGPGPPPARNVPPGTPALPGKGAPAGKSANAPRGGAESPRAIALPLPPDAIERSAR